MEFKINDTAKLEDGTVVTITKIDGDKITVKNSDDQEMEVTADKLQANKDINEEKLTATLEFSENSGKEAKTINIDSETDSLNTIPTLIQVALEDVYERKFEADVTTIIKETLSKSLEEVVIKDGEDSILVWMRNLGTPTQEIGFGKTANGKMSGTKRDENVWITLVMNEENKSDQVGYWAGISPGSGSNGYIMESRIPTLDKFLKNVKNISEGGVIENDQTFQDVKLFNMLGKFMEVKPLENFKADFQKEFAGKEMTKAKVEEYVKSKLGENNEIIKEFEKENLYESNSNTSFTSKDKERKIEFHKTPAGNYEYAVMDYDTVAGEFDKANFQKIDVDWLEEEKEAFDKNFADFVDKIKKGINENFKAKIKIFEAKKLDVPFINESLTEPADYKGLINNLKIIAEKLEVFHHNTKVFSQHKAFDEIQESFNDLKDDLIEKIMGYVGERYESSNIGEIVYTDKTGIELVEDIKAIGVQLIKFSKDNSYTDIENIGQSVEGLGAKLNYLLTLNEGKLNEEKLNPVWVYSSDVDAVAIFSIEAQYTDKPQEISDSVSDSVDEERGTFKVLKTETIDGVTAIITESKDIKDLKNVILLGGKLTYNKSKDKEIIKKCLEKALGEKITSLDII
jgi:hypothetical protein